MLLLMKLSSCWFADQAAGSEAGGSTFEFSCVEKGAGGAVIAATCVVNPVTGEAVVVGAFGGRPLLGLVAILASSRK